MKLFSVNTIINGRFYAMYEPSPNELVFPALRQFGVDRKPPSTPAQRAAQYELDEANKLPRDLEAAVEEESKHRNGNIYQARIVNNDRHYGLPGADAEAEPPLGQYELACPQPDEPEDESDSEPPPRVKPKPNQRYIRRGVSWKRIEGLMLQPGEKIYKRQGNAFVACGRVPPKPKPK